ncbi:MAG: glycosyltransferase [Actinomycetota bacterium]|nr:glycosyltransferase [Actinomycetota bacterium]
MFRPLRLGPSLCLVSLAGVAATGHLVYPAALYLWTRKLPDQVPPMPDLWPPLTVVVAAYREEAVIAAKVEDTRANGYPGALLVAVVADDLPTAEAARSAGAEVQAAGERLGKAEAVNRGVGAARTEIVVITDANTLLAPGTLAALVRWFEDPTVDAVAGEKGIAGTSGEGTYWRFESWLKQAEARTGATVGLVGELAAVRRSAFRPLPRDVIVDDLWLALDILEDGGRIAYEAQARAEELSSPDWRTEWERRTRILSGVLDVLWRRRRLLAPGRGWLAVQLWGHRLVRSSVGPLAHLTLLTIALGSLRRSRLARLTVAGHALGAAAAVRTQLGKADRGPERVVGQALFLQAVALGGVFRYLRGDRPAHWPKPARPAPTASAPA